MQSSSPNAGDSSCPHSNGWLSLCVLVTNTVTLTMREPHGDIIASLDPIQTQKRATFLSEQYVVICWI